MALSLYSAWTDVAGAMDNTLSRAARPAIPGHLRADTQPFSPSQDQALAVGEGETLLQG